MPTTLIKSDTKVYCTYKKQHLDKYILVEIKNENGFRTYKLTYYNDRKEQFRTINLDSDVMKARLRYLRDEQPEKLMELLNKGLLYLHLLRIDNKVDKAVNRQVQLWQETDKEYIAASGDFFKQFGILQRMRMDAEHLLYPAMVYV